MRIKLATLSAVAFFASSAASLTAAQEEQAASSNSIVVEEVVVTANRREENLSEVPMSVSAFGEDFFKDTGANDLASMEQYTPSLKITPGADSRSTSIRIRGIGSVGTNSGIDPSVGIFIDGIYQGRAGMSISDLIDIQSLIVLRGPQGSLYGKNTAAGAISVTTKKPGPDFEGLAETVIGSDDQLEIRGMINIPLGDNGNAMRATAFSNTKDHMYYNTANGEHLNDSNKWGVKSRFLFNTDESGEFLVTVDFSQEDTDCCALSVIDYDGLSTLNTPSTNTPSAEWQAALGRNSAGDLIMDYTAFEDSQGFSPPKADPFSDDRWLSSQIYNDVEVGGLALEWNYDLANDDTLTFINAWRHYESLSSADGDFTAYESVETVTDVKLDQFSTELRITSPGGEVWDYQGGLYGYYSEFDSYGEFTQFPALTEAIGLGSDGTLNIDENIYTTTSFAAFGQLVWNITDQWSATLGMRYTWEKKEREGYQISTPPIADAIPPVAGPNTWYDQSREDSDISPSFSLKYFWNDDLMTYASISRGFKSGGFNQRRELEGEAPPPVDECREGVCGDWTEGVGGEFDEEIATNYELGWKASWMDRRLTLNGTFFFVEYDDFQGQTFSGSDIKVTNAGSLESYGVEIDGMFVATMNLTMGTAIGYNKATYEEFDGGQCTVNRAFYEYYIVDGNQAGFPGGGECTVDLAGEPLDNAPELTVSSWFQYEAEMKELMLISRLEHNYVDSFFLDQDLDGALFNEEVDLVNVRFTLTNPERVWEVAVFGNNLLDEEYYSFGLDIPVMGGYTAVTAPGVTYGLNLRYNFY
ncbi:TonB-dependent receptor [Oceanicoccus sagamiensis]|uniref:TonB-dependent receptor n=1 Tax=Oceanicoccus sagamiensis TaxID=716816 RepID=A0A1X9NP86_9GAMM|nr:TonB-dependent receptor [Oceanicoccus sagamiensis]ARN75703.1 hypothetical protein BST96_17270 [Oceanicoccus sagamiensis]